MATKQDLKAAVDQVKAAIAAEASEVQAKIGELVEKVAALSTGEPDVLITQGELDEVVSDLQAIAAKVEAISGDQSQPSPGGDPGSEPEPQVDPGPGDVGTVQAGDGSEPAVVPEPGTSVEGETASEDVFSSEGGAKTEEDPQTP